MSDSPYALVLGGPAGRRFGVRLDRPPVGVEFAETRGPVVEDVETGVRIGEAGATCQPLLVDIGGEQHVLLAGTPDLPEQRFTAIDGTPYPVHEGVWMSFPEPFQPGWAPTISGLDADGRELFRIQSPPLDAARLTPLFGPGWTTFAPLSER